MDDQILRKVQMVQLEIAKEIKRVCEEIGINYFLTDGSLIGAIRHKGFIPWDDDLDMGMKREEYDKFLELAPKLLSPKYELIQWRKNKGYAHPMAKVVKNGTIFLEGTRGDSENKGIWVDIFPFDHYCDDDKEAQKNAHLRTYYKGIIRAKCKYATWKTDNKINWAKYFKNVPFRVLSIFYDKIAVAEKFDKISKKYNNIKTKRCYENGPGHNAEVIIPAEYIDKFVETEFEDTTFKIPAEYDAYLRLQFGDYMKLPPESQRRSFHSIIKIDFGEE